VQPRVVSVSQTTELGTLYAPEELRALADHAHDNGLLLHVDGARLTNAAAALRVPLRAIAGDAGADVVSFGGTKAGLLAAEAVVLLAPGLEAALPYLRKQTLQLASKARFLAAQLDALLTGERWRAAAGHANDMAARLAAAVGEVPGVTVTQQVRANAVFAILPPGAADRLREDWFFYDWDEAAREVRWMCAWDTAEADVDAFAAAVRAACA
jgi:threonine aldolase